MISVVVPAFNEARNLPRLVDGVRQALRAEEAWELIVVDDGSRDDTLPVLQGLAASVPNLRFLSLTRNFGHQAALKAGLDHARGACVISLDADLQHPPELIPEMLRRWREGGEVVNMIRVEAAVPFTKRATSRVFYAVTNAISDYRIEPGSSDFRLLDGKVVDALRQIQERNLFLRGLIPWLGFRQVNMTYAPAPRHAGTTKYSLRKMVRLALLGLTSSSLRPLHCATLVGGMMSVLALCYAVYALWAKFVAGTAITGWTSLLISVLLIGGLQLMMLGIMGEYLGRSLIEIKARPPYVVREHNLLPRA